MKRINEILRKKNLWLGVSAVLIVLIIGLLIGLFRIITVAENNIDEKRADFILQKESIIKELIAQGKYKCCLEKPCTYCIEKSPGHGEGATCNCLKDVVTGVHPCGECIGEILEGHGNPHLVEYFAKSITEKVGEQYENTLKQIISEKYDIPVEEQI